MYTELLKNVISSHDPTLIEVYELKSCPLLIKNTFKLTIGN